MDQPLTLAETDAVDLGYVSDLYALLRAIDEAMPQDAVLCIEGTAVAPEVASFLEARQTGHPPPAIAPNTSWPEPRFFHLPLIGSNLSDLRDLADRHAEPEIANHLVVYCGRNVLLWAHDAGAGHVSLSRHLPQATMDAFRSKLGNALRPDHE
jgi:hypothetical protein